MRCAPLYLCKFPLSELPVEDVVKEGKYTYDNYLIIPAFLNVIRRAVEYRCVE